MHSVVNALVVKKACPNSHKDAWRWEDAAGYRVKQPVHNRRDNDPIRRMHQDFGGISRRRVMPEVGAIHDFPHLGALEWEVYMKEESVHAVLDQGPGEEADDEKPQQVCPVARRFGPERKAKKNESEDREYPEGAKTI